MRDVASGERTLPLMDERDVRSKTRLLNLLTFARPLGAFQMRLNRSLM